MRTLIKHCHSFNRMNRRKREEGRGGGAEGEVIEMSRRQREEPEIGYLCGVCAPCNQSLRRFPLFSYFSLSLRLGANVQITFSIATVDPNGNPTTGLFSHTRANPHTHTMCTGAQDITRLFALEYTHKHTSAHTHTTRHHMSAILTLARH